MKPILLISVLLCAGLFTGCPGTREAVTFEEGGKFAEMGTKGDFELRAAESVIAYDHALKSFHGWALRNLAVVNESQTLSRIYAVVSDELDDTVSGVEPLSVYYALKTTYEQSSSAVDKFSYEEQIRVLEQLTLQIVSSI